MSKQAEKSVALLYLPRGHAVHTFVAALEPAGPFTGVDPGAQAVAGLFCVWHAVPAVEYWPAAHWLHTARLLLAVEVLPAAQFAQPSVAEIAPDALAAYLLASHA